MTPTAVPKSMPPRRWSRWCAVALVLEVVVFGAMIVAQIREINVTRGVRASFLASPDSRGDLLVTFMSQKIVRLNNELYLIIGLGAVVSAGTLAGALLLGRRD